MFFFFFFCEIFSNNTFSRKKNSFHISQQQKKKVSLSFFYKFSTTKKKKNPFPKKIKMSQQENLPSSEPSSFLLVGNVDDDANFANAIKTGHTANDQPIVAGETHMVLLTRSRFLVDLLSFNASPEAISKMQTGEDLLQDPELWLKMQSQCKVDVPRQDVFVGTLQVRTFNDFVSKTKELLEQAAKLQSSGKSEAEIKKLQQQLEDAEKQAQASQKQGWIGWGVNLGLRTMTLGLVGTSTFTGGNNNANTRPHQQIANLSLCSPSGVENAFRMAIACSQQGALAIMLDGISAQFSAYDDVNVGEVSDTDVLPPSAPTRRSCVAVKLIGSSKNIPVLEVRKLLRLFRVLPNGTASTMMFVHTLLTVPLTPEGKHEVCLEWKVTLPPVPQLPEQKKQQTTPVQQQQPVAPVPLILAEQIPEAVATSRVLNDEELARQLQLQFDSEEQRVKDEQMKRDSELAKALAANPPEGGISVASNNNDDDDYEGAEGKQPKQTLLEEAVAARRKRGGRRGGNNNNGRAQQETAVETSVSSSTRTCQCLGASAGFHKPSCEYAQRA